MYKVVLASNSPRRKEILAQVGIDFVAVPSNKEEVITKELPGEIVQELSDLKATDVANSIEDQAIIIGADTIVAKNGEILGKPKDLMDATRMLTMLQGDSHSVFTGVTAIIKTRVGDHFEIKKVQFAEETKVFVREMTVEQMIAYINTKEPMDKAGSYGIQGRFAKYVKGIEGDFYNVMGFPISKFCETMSKEGIDLIQ
ncbi:septum formation protein Maf [Lachnospiraceae bacterium KM106-2]|nr:septum formation protein Maf [Lachnospiraceae bacterium KM106-2]